MAAAEDAVTRRRAAIVIVVALVVGAPLLWWFSNLTEEIKTLAATDRDAAIALFRARIVPVLFVLVAVGVVLGVVLGRQGVLMQRDPRTRLAGFFLVATAVLSAAIPITLLAVTMWALARV